VVPEGEEFSKDVPQHLARFDLVGGNLIEATPWKESQIVGPNGVGYLRIGREDAGTLVRPLGSSLRWNEIATICTIAAPKPATPAGITPQDWIAEIQSKIEANWEKTLRLGDNVMTPGASGDPTPGPPLNPDDNRLTTATYTFHMIAE
jgi:hypothetical protein